MAFPLKFVDEIRVLVNTLLDDETRGAKGQFMTPASVAKLLAAKFKNLDGSISILDAGAGVGSLTTALIERSLNSFQPESISVNAWEIEPILAKHMEKSFEINNEFCRVKAVSLNTYIHNIDFIQSAVDIINARKNGEKTVTFNKAILNPPYLKVASKSKERELLRSIGVETGNLYSCFVSLALMLLDDGGELVAITPRSFCNGPYFNDFRRVLLDNNALCKIHIFESRTSAFKDDNVLQENVIFHVIKGQTQSEVEIASSSCASDPELQIRIAQFDEVVSPHNPDRFIHIITNDEQAEIAQRIGGMPCSLYDLGIQASTGKVVDFRTKPNLRQKPEEGSVPLIFPVHFNNGRICWPLENIKKPNALARNIDTEKQLIPNGNYVLVKRLSAKEENRRIVAAMYTPDITDAEMVGFDNKTNYFHADGEPLELNFAKGLWVYLNSTIVDQYFRQFNGHTQVNATDLYVLRYPSYETLIQLGSDVVEYEQKHIDDLISKI